MPNEAVLIDLSFESVEFLAGHFDSYRGPRHVAVKNKTCAVVEITALTDRLDVEYTTADKPNAEVDPNGTAEIQFYALARREDEAECKLNGNLLL